MMKKSMLILLVLLFSELLLFSQAEWRELTITEDLELVKLSDQAFIHVSYQEIPQYGRVSANGLIYINENKAVIIDTPWNDEQTKILIDHVKRIFSVDIQSVIATHWHEDCMGGLNEVNKSGIDSYSLDLTQKIAESKNLPVPEHTFKDSLLLELGGEKILCKYPGAGHTVDNIVVWIPAEKILFGGCLIRTSSARGLGNTADADIDKWPVTVKKVLAEFGSANIVIPGHGPHGGTELIEHTIDLLETR